MSSIAGFCLCATAQTGTLEKNRERKRLVFSNFIMACSVKMYATTGSFVCYDIKKYIFYYRFPDIIYNFAGNKNPITMKTSKLLH
ncbi:MAG: hypothetical protein K2H16_02400, partial [Prevotella sp.]|nr:hypothetical protein [Prevotella sp.]